MHRRQIIFGLVTLPLLGGCWLPLPSYKYRLTVQVDTPEGVRTGSTIIEVKNFLTYGISAGMGRHARGEAAIIDLGKRGLLFALLKGDEYEDWANGIYGYLTPPIRESSSRYENGRLWIKAIKENSRLIELPRHISKRWNVSGYPMLLKFSDPLDHQSMEWVDPDNLSIFFGEGVSLRQITVQITEAEPEPKIVKYLPWLDQNPGPIDLQRHPKSGLRRIVDDVTTSAFRR